MRAADPHARSHEDAGGAVAAPDVPVDELRARIRKVLASAGFLDAATEADVLVAHVLGRSRGDLEYVRLMGRGVPPADADRVERAASIRARRVPLQRIVGRAPFLGLELAVGPGVFTPRPETEVLVHAVADRFASRRGERLDGVDLGSGSGAVALGIASLLPGARIAAIEASPAAWPWLRRNVEEHGEGRVTAVFGRVGEVGPGAGPRRDGESAAGGAGARAPLDFVVSNPPYIPAANSSLDPEVRLFDPASALYGGDDGLDDIRVFADYAAGVLGPGGLVAFEHDDHQGPEARALLEERGFQGAVTLPDLAGRDRATLATLPAPEGSSASAGGDRARLPGARG